MRNNFTLNKTFDKLYRPFPLSPRVPIRSCFQHPVPAAHTPSLARAHGVGPALGLNCGQVTSRQELCPRTRKTRCSDRSQPKGVQVTHSVIQTNWLTTTPPCLCSRSWRRGGRRIAIRHSSQLLPSGILDSIGLVTHV